MSGVPNEGGVPPPSRSASKIKARTVPTVLTIKNQTKGSQAKWEA